MENATKALLIAASILIVILLIGFGMMMFKSTDSSASDADEVGTAISIEARKAVFKLKGVKTGDVYRDGTINSTDSMKMKQLIREEKYMDEADLNFDGKVDDKDVKILEQIIKRAIDG